MIDRIAVIAGTYIDTEMGVDCLAKKGITDVLSLPISKSPLEQFEFQISSEKNKRSAMLRILAEAKNQGCERVFVYCNSLSGAVDFPPLAAETDMRIITPLDAYRNIAPKYRNIAVIAANAQGLSGIEKIMTAANPSIRLLNCSLRLATVEDIEAGEKPSRIIEKYHLDKLTQWFAENGSEAAILGCTHFPYFKEALAAVSPIGLIDPADDMIELLCR